MIVPTPIRLKTTEDMQKLLKFDAAVFREDMTNDSLFRLDIITIDCLTIDWRNVKLVNNLIDELKKFGLNDLRAVPLSEGSIFMYRPVNGKMLPSRDNPETKIIFKARLSTPLHTHLKKIKLIR